MQLEGTRLLRVLLRRQEENVGEAVPVAVEEGAPADADVVEDVESVTEEGPEEREQVE